MRSRGTRLIFGAIGWIAIGAVAFFVVDSERRILAQQGVVVDFDQRAGLAVAALAELRAAQEAYVAAGQSVATWTPKVAGAIDSAAKTIDNLRRSASSAEARTALDAAAASVTELGNIDTRTRDYLKSDQPLMAADIVFAEGGEAAAEAARQIERARLAEHQASDAAEAAQRWREAVASAGAAGLAALIILLLALAPAPLPSEAAASQAVAAVPDTSLMRLREEVPDKPAAMPPPVAPPAPSPRAVSPVLKAAADLCTDFGRVNDLEGLTAMLGRAAEVMDASGVIVWVGNAAGADLQAAAAHGYSPQVLARMPTVPRAADNAAAAAYRLGQLQVVASRPGTAGGAVVAPLVSVDGCIGALSAEIRDGGETSASVHALATIFAAQLAGILTAVPSQESSRAAASG